jgi:hypothetical protein
LIELPMYAVRKQAPDGVMLIVSAWSDAYDAKYEAARWEQDYKIHFDYVPATLVLRGEDEENDDADQEPLQITL